MFFEYAKTFFNSYMRFVLRMVKLKRMTRKKKVSKMIAILLLFVIVLNRRVWMIRTTRFLSKQGYAKHALGSPSKTQYHNRRPHNLPRLSVSQQSNYFE